ncbi:serine dehydratase subunit alpha family protein [Clostridium sp. AM58-1XD]|nr:L-serine ammonia-lyase, iron-sulfur-dependent, subunit alpha [Clostridium sp. AM58-1XD]RGY98131.1 serine dehydratase subunit alpha family protein [Clostridium sp. AM58-1XD]
MLELLHQDIVPALGCTEPVCIALAAADAAKAVGGRVKRLHAELSKNIYKNAMSVGIPGFNQVGIPYAAALGACIADPSTGLEIFKQIDEKVAGEARKLADSGGIILSVSENERGIYVRCEAETENGTGISVIRGGHTNIVLTQANDTVLVKREMDLPASGSVLLDRLKMMTVSEIRALVASADEEELDFLMAGAEMNQILADYGLQEGQGIGIAEVLNRNCGGAIIGNGLMERIMVQVAAATEARLEGCPYATMSSAGSGSKGIAVILPVMETVRTIGADRRTALKGLAFAHLLNEYINAHIGKLSAVCSCAMASATAASAAVTWLLGGTDEQIGWAIRNMTGSIAGMICDGGKTGCALKLSAATMTGIISALLAVNGVGLRPTDGICAETPEACIRSMSRISSPGMVETDGEILRIMVEKGIQAAT